MKTIPHRFSYNAHWYVSFMTALSATSSLFLFNIPFCLGCAIAQFFLWCRLGLRKKHHIIFCFAIILGIQVSMLWTRQHHLVCPFSIDQYQPSCHSLSSGKIAGYDFLEWSTAGTVFMTLWAFSWQKRGSPS